MPIFPTYKIQSLRPLPVISCLLNKELKALVSKMKIYPLNVPIYVQQQYTYILPRMLEQARPLFIRKTDFRRQYKFIVKKKRKCSDY